MKNNRMTLAEYQYMREDHWDATIGKAIKEKRRKASYGTVSADAIIARFRKYEREYNTLINNTKMAWAMLPIQKKAFKEANK